MKLTTRAGVDAARQKRWFHGDFQRVLIRWLFVRQPFPLPINIMESHNFMRTHVTGAWALNFAPIAHETQPAGLVTPVSYWLWGKPPKTRATVYSSWWNSIRGADDKSISHEEITFCGLGGKHLIATNIHPMIAIIRISVIQVEVSKLN